MVGEVEVIAAVEKAFISLDLSEGWRLQMSSLGSFEAEAISAMVENSAFSLIRL